MRTKEGGKETTGETSAFKMAGSLMADEFEIFRNEFRPVHVARLENKIACPHPVCEEAVFLQRKRHKIWQALRPPSVPFP